MLAFFNRLLDSVIPRWITCILVFTQVSITLIICASVAARAVFHIDLYANEEFILVLAFWLYMMGGAYGSSEQSHISADLVSEYARNHAAKRLVLLCVKAVEVFVLIVFCYWACLLMIWNIERGAVSIAWKIPVILPQSSILLGFVIMLAYAIRDLHRLIKGQIPGGTPCI